MRHCAIGLTFIAALAIGAIPSVIANADASNAGATTLVPRGTIVPVLITKDIRIGGIGSNTEEKKVEFEVSQDVIVNGFVIAKTGDLVEGHFTNERNETRRMFSVSTSQELALDIDDAVNFCGDTLHLKFERTYVGGGVTGSLIFGHAHDAVFSKGLILKAMTDRVEKGICAEGTTEAPAPLPADIIVPDEEVTPEP